MWPVRLTELWHQATRRRHQTAWLCLTERCAWRGWRSKSPFKNDFWQVHLSITQLHNICFSFRRRRPAGADVLKHGFGTWALPCALCTARCWYIQTRLKVQYGGRVLLMQRIADAYLLVVAVHWRLCQKNMWKNVNISYFCLCLCCCWSVCFTSVMKKTKTITF